jgi:hypothetical protein
MNRRNGKTTGEDSALRDNDDVPDLWSINPWLTSHMIGAAHSQRLDAAEQKRVHAMFASRSEEAGAAIADILQEELKKDDEGSEQGLG